MSDLVTFLRARIAEDEAAARAATAGPWRWGHWRGGPAPEGEDEVLLSSSATRVLGGESFPEVVLTSGGAHGADSWLIISDADGEHIARWDPARVLAEVAAKRQIMDDHIPEEAGATWDAKAKEAFGCNTCHQTDGGLVFGYGWCHTLRALALPYAGHFDFNPDWRLS